MSEDSCEGLEILDKTLTGSGTGLYDMLAEDLTNLPRERWKLSWLVCLFSNVIQPRVTWEKGTSGGDLPCSDWPVAMSVKVCLSWR